MKKYIKWLLIILCIPACIYIALGIIGEILSKPLLVESKEAINAYSGNGVAKYLQAPDFGIDGVSIKMPSFIMKEGLNIEYDLVGLPEGNPYSIDLIISLGPDATYDMLSPIFQGEWTYLIKKNGVVINKKSDKLKNINMASHVNSENMPKELLFNFFSLDENHQSDHCLTVDERAAHYSISIIFTNNALQEPLEAYLELSRGGGK